MKKSQDLQLKISLARERLAKVVEKRNALPQGEPVSSDILKEMDESVGAIQPLEVEYRASIVLEDEQENKEKREQSADFETSEKRQLNELISKASLFDFVDEARSGKSVNGASLECRQALLGEGAKENLLPIQLLAPKFNENKIEERADAESTLASGSENKALNPNFLNSVFPQSNLNALGIPMIPVPVGEAQFVAVTTAPTAGVPARAAAQDAEAVVFEPFSLTPRRAQSRVQFARESTFRMAGLEELLRTEIRNSLGNELDKQVISGANGFTNELTNPTDPAVITYQNFVDTYTGLIDGTYSAKLSDLRVICGAKTYEVAVTKFRTTSSEVSATDFIDSRTAGLSVSGHIPAPASNIQRAVVAKISAPGNNAVLPVWTGLEILVDPYSESSKGLISLTATLFFNFKILREAAFALVEHKTA